MRLFMAIQFSPAVREALLAAQRALCRQGRGIFTQPENLHLTLAFIGETEHVAQAETALAEISCCPFSLTVGGSLGHFGDLWWAGIQADDVLGALAASLQEDLRRRGFSIERRAWRPHVTLVRRWQGPIPAVTVPTAHMEVRRLSLMRSDRTDGRLVYTEVTGRNLHF